MCYEVENYLCIKKKAKKKKQSTRERRKRMYTRIYMKTEEKDKI